MIGFKMFECDTRNNTLYPLFIDRNNPVPVGKNIKCEVHYTHGFAKRAGWHVGTIPDAPWLKSMDGTYKAKNRNSFFKRVWCMVWYPDNEIDVTGKDLNEYVPADGYYRYREASTKSEWRICSDIKILMILDDKQVLELLDNAGVDTKKTFEPYRLAYLKREYTNAKNKEMRR